MRSVSLLFLLGMAAAGHAAGADSVGGSRPEVLRDVEGYAVASCLVKQAEPYLRDQGDAWASVIVQRMKGDVAVLAALAEQVNKETAKGMTAFMRSESEPGKDKALPVLYCSEIIDRPAVRAEIRKAVGALKTSYRR